jgi:hypothetical protein
MEKKNVVVTSLALFRAGGFVANGQISGGVILQTNVWESTRKKRVFADEI